MTKFKKFKKVFDYCEICEDPEAPRQEVARAEGEDFAIYLCEECLNKMLKVLKEDK